MEELRNINMNLDIVKLFVGQIPKEMDEDSLRVYFEEFGPLAELSIIRDSANLNSKGCAFVTYRHAESAQCAVDKLHDKVKLPNSLNALQVRVAETQTERENKLFIGMLPKTVNEQDLHGMFVPYGELREVHIIRGPEGSPKGCAFVKYVDRDAAIAAIEDLNDSIPMGATRPLVVKFADSKKQTKSKSDFSFDNMDGGGQPFQMGMKSGGNDYWAGQAPPQQKMMYPYSMSPLSSPQQQHMLPYQPAGMNNGPQSSQQRYNMYMPTPPAPSNYYQGQAPAGGNLPYGAPAQQHDPLEKAKGGGFNNQSPYLQSERTPEQPASGYSIVAPSDVGHFGEESDELAPAALAVSSVPSGDHESHSRPPEGPSGANLFIYHLPRDLTDADLATLFAPFGNVISAKVFVDKKTSDSKGFGFVSYDTLDSANSAIESMNGFQIGSKRLKVQHKRVMSGGMDGDDSSWGGGGGGGGGGNSYYGGGGGGGGGGDFSQRGGGGGGGGQYNQPPPQQRRGGGGGSVNSLVGSMGGMSMYGSQQQMDNNHHQGGGGGGSPLDYYGQQPYGQQQQQQRGGAPPQQQQYGYNDYNMGRPQQQQQQQIPPMAPYRGDVQQQQQQQQRYYSNM